MECCTNKPYNIEWLYKSYNNWIVFDHLTQNTPQIKNNLDIVFMEDTLGMSLEPWFSFINQFIACKRLKQSLDSHSVLYGPILRLTQLPHSFICYFICHPWLRPRAEQKREQMTLAVSRESFNKTIQDALYLLWCKIHCSW